MSRASNLSPALPFTDRNLGIDLLRVISIILVILYHYELGHFMLSGLHGVVIFFMISGYCMSYSIENRSGREFLQARFWRLIPTFILCVTITTSIEWALPHVRHDRIQNVISYVINLVCMPNGMLICDVINIPFKGRAMRYAWVDGAYWSLLVEVRFYLLLWLLYYVVKMRHAAWGVAALGLLAPLNFATPLISKSEDFFLYLSFFAFGMAYSACARKVKYAELSLLFSFLVFTLNSYFSSNGLSMSLNLKYYFSFVLCFVLFLIVMYIFKGKTNRYVTSIGILSYPIYLLHQDIGYISIKLLGDHLPKIPTALITTALIFLLAAGVQRFLDKHQSRIRAYCERRFSRAWRQSV